ncbi:MAG: 3-isopropylmalate/(R)-2-methylmalate dehydratase small subunit [Clostridia bacterium]|nr:3-isopropylmalate/(R)-2-methylmalate dehydratase small subunit [Clostridia bacterium]
MLLKGKAHCYGDYFNTDLHLSAKYRPAGTTLEELVQTMLINIDPDFSKRVAPGDFLVAGEFFGADSSREDAVEVLKKAGIAAVIAKSFAHLFFRNAINLGLLVIQADTGGIATNHLLEVDV